MLKALEVSKFLLFAAEVNQMEGITPLKLQKLLYYAQGRYLGKYGTPLFEDKIYKWKYGPVVENIYNEYKKFGSSPINVERNLEFNFDDSVSDHLIQILKIYGNYSAFALSEMTHNEAPWIETQLDMEITNPVLKKYFVSSNLG